MTPKIKNLFQYFMRIAISGLLLWYLFAKLINVQEMLEAVKNANIYYVLLALVTFVVIQFFLLYRWFIYIKALGLEVSSRDVVRYFFIGLFGNLFLPSAIGGDIIKIVGLCSDSGQKAKVVASVLLDRLSGFVAIVIIASLAFIFGYRFVDDKTLAYPIMIIAGIMIGLGILLFNEKVYGFFCRGFSFLPKLKKKIMDLHYDISLLKGKKVQGYLAVFVSCVSQSTFVLTFFLLSRALGQDIPILYFFIFVPLICISAMVPSIGGLGVREAGSVYLFGKIGLEAGVAASMSLINFFFMVLAGLVGGLIYVFTLSSGRLQHKQSIASEPSR